MSTHNGTTTPMAPSVELAPGADENGLAPMLQTLIEQNLEAHPERASALRGMRGTVHIRATDIDTDVALHFDGTSLRISAGHPPAASVRIRATCEQVLDLTRVQLVAGMVPDPRDAIARGMLRDMAGGEIAVVGMLRNPVLVLRLLQLVNVGSA